MLRTPVLLFLLVLAAPSFAQQYTFKSNIPTPRSAPACAVVEDAGGESSSKIYVFGGSVGGPASNITEEYDVLTDTWTTKTPMPFSCLEGFAATVDGKIYVIGGYDNGAALNKVQQYDPVTNSWTLKADMPTARSLLSGGVVDNKIYVVGGWTGEYKELEIYDPATNTWSAGADALYGVLQNNGGAVLDDAFYFIGGRSYDQSSFYDYTTKYDPATDTWIARQPLPAPRFSGAAVSYNNKIHFFGGATGIFVPNVNSHYVFTPPNTWSSGLQMPVRRAGHVAVTAHNKVYIIGGVDSTPALASTVIEYSETILDIDQVHAGNSFASIYTDVAAASITITKNDREPADIAIYNLNGVRIYSSTQREPSSVIELGHLAKGIYIVRLQNSNRCVTEKIIL